MPPQSPKTMNESFDGYLISEDTLAGIPNDFFRKVLPTIEDINLLKLCLYTLWKANTIGDYGISYTAQDILLDKIFTDGLFLNGVDSLRLIQSLLDQAGQKDFLLRWQEGQDTEPIFFINCEDGKKALEMAAKNLRSSHVTLDQIQPNIYKLYEQNIGPLTPLIADTLRDAEETYPAEWISEAIEIAVQNNVRRWRYVQSILDRWKKEGRNGADRRRDKTDYRSYLDD